MRTPIHYRSADGTLELYAEDRGNSDARLSVLCMHGLTRNSKDFGALVDHLSARYRVVSVDQRGRGRSQWDANVSNYQPAVYAQDMFKLLDHLGIDRAVLVGTSMGGLIAMTMAAMQPRRLRGIVLNDIGPEVPTQGLKRLRDSLVAPTQISSWSDAARQAQRVNGLAFPDYGAEDWLAFAERTYTEDESGRPVAAYDRAILNGLINADLSVVPANLWSLWAQLGSIPLLAIRGGLSDILSAEILQRMAASHPRMTALTLANRGHAPMLDEPAAVAAIDTFLDGLP
jgi:pimeloyl-ACP methyl ester carboxylesterase